MIIISKPNNSSSKSKSATVLEMLRRRHGATIDEVMEATSWKPHSCRAFLSGVRQSDVGIVKEERTGGKTAYRIIAETESLS